MRIAVVGPTYPFRGGIAHYTTLLVRHLRMAGHITFFYSFTRQYPAWLFPGRSDRDPSSVPLRVECEYLLDPINPLTWWRLVRRVRSERPDLLLLQWWVPYWTPSLTVISSLLKRPPATKIAMICHNVLPHDGGGVIDRRLAWTVLRRADALIVHSELDRYRARALMPHAKIVKAFLPTYEPVINEVAVAGLPALRAEWQVPDRRRILLFFGFVRPYKGLEYLIQALAHARSQIDVHLLVVGEIWGSLAYYQRYAAEFGVADAITFVNRYVPNEELPPIFAAADVVVLPYVSATQSAVVQLALGFGKPVITTNVGGLPEVVQDGVNGLIVPPQDAMALAQAIVRYFQADLGPILTANIQAATAERAESWPRLVAIITELARELNGVTA
ncbi:glycosyltransferase [Chloroflexus sp.]|uniref:glycosyltransferase n=1 Tax=Chloroflexus sp. TaxID=1904827 RepID=UPI00298F3819|nr:glycosyltransferase [Chloroflexus sp.]MDW8404065.1 glycosyltransferase [Chloroflexus sp.]